MIQDFSIKMNNAPVIKLDCMLRKQRWFSGGTIASMLNMMEKSKIDKNMKKIIKDPYAFNILNRWKGKVLVKEMSDGIQILTNGLVLL